jgi:micrococcal nuclease
MMMTRSIALLIFVGANLLTGCVWVPTMVTQGMDAATTIREHRSFYATAEDYATRSEIRSRFFDESFGLDVSADVYQGRVMLTGVVKNAAIREKAERLARQVPAVQEIFNDLQISDEGGIFDTLRDVFIENELKLKLMMADGVNSINYRCRANNGMLSLLGSSQSPEELARVVSIARETEGVHKVIIHVASQESDAVQIAQPPADFLRGEVIAVSNGNSFAVMIGDRLVKVRLIGSDAPDMTHSSMGTHAREILGGLVRGKIVRLETDDDRWDVEKRLLAYVYVEDVFVNLEMIRQGHAFAQTEPPNLRYGDEYRKAQAEARGAGRGVWGRKRAQD